MAGSLDGDGERALVAGAGAGHTAGEDLASLGNEPAQLGHIFVVDEFSPVYAESAYLAACQALGKPPSFRINEKIVVSRF